MTDLAKKTGFSDKLTLNLINSSGRALVGTAINGGNLEDTLKTALLGGLVDTVHGEVASAIKGLEADYLAHKLAHALAGCVAGAAAGGTCKDGAIGSAVGEMVADLFKDQKPGANATLAEIKAYNAKVQGYSKLVAGAVAAYAGGNAQTAITTAEIAVQNNYLSKPQLLALQAELNTCKQNSCSETQVNAVLDKYVALSSANDAALSACTTTACVEGHRKTLLDAAAYSTEVMWQVANARGSEQLINELLGRQNKAATLQYVYGRAQAIEQARKQLDQYVQTQCVGLSQQACSTKLSNSQATSTAVTEMLAGFTPAGIAVDIKDLLQAKTMGDYSLAVLGIVLPGLGDGVKTILNSSTRIPSIATVDNIVHGTQALSLQQKRSVELLTLFDKNHPNNGIELAGTQYKVFDTNPAGTTKTIDTVAMSDDVLQKQVFDYAQQLAGGRIIDPHPAANGVWVAKLENGTTLNVRSVSTSGAGRWTVEITGNSEIQSIMNKKKVEVKFK